MKVLRIGILALAFLFLVVGICYAQSAKEYYDKGVEYGLAGKFEEAQEEFRKALEADPFCEPAKVCLEMVEDALKQRIKTKTALHLFKAAAYATKGMPDEVIAQLKKAIEIHPNYAEAHNSLGGAYAHKGMYSEAIAEYKKAIEINSKFASAYYNLGLAYNEKGMYDEAIAELKKAIEIHPNYAEAHCDLGVTYSIKGMYDEAIAELKKAIEIHPNYAEAHNNLAVAYYFKGEYSLAIKHCDRAIELGYRVHPEFLEALKPYR